MAYCLDQATVLWGTHITFELEMAQHRGDKDVMKQLRDQERKLAKLLGLPQKFADPATMLGHKEA